MDVPSEMVERVAQAIYEAKRRIEGVDSTWDEVKDRASRPDGYAYAKLAYDASTKAARAAIEAMMEPSDEELAAAGIWNDDSGSPYVSDFHFFRSQLAALLCSALSPSLKEQERTP